MATAATEPKRKRVVLAIELKLKILELLDKGTSYSVITEESGIGRSTVTGIKREKENLLKFKREAKEMGMKKTTKAMKLGKDTQLEEASYVWFRQKRAEGVPISGPLLKEKALQLNEMLDGNADFHASEGWSGSFAGGMVSTSYLFKERSCLAMTKAPKNMTRT